MQIIPVLDLAGGIAVRAQAGDRTRYAPLQSTLVPDRAGDAAALLRAFHTLLGPHEYYLADLDAIQGGALQRSFIRELAQPHTGSTLLVDAGTSRPEAALEVLACGATEVVVGLETLPAFADLVAVLDVMGPSRVVFSLDLRLGNPILHPAMPQGRGAGPNALELAGQAVAAGVEALLLLDLGRVGTGWGLDLGLIEAVRHRFPDIRLLAGGGVLTRGDLERMGDAGCDGALIASAIHSGRVTATDLAELSSSRLQTD